MFGISPDFIADNDDDDDDAITDGNDIADNS
jgi:hypothetical protein